MAVRIFIQHVPPLTTDSIFSPSLEFPIIAFLTCLKIITIHISILPA